MSTKTDRDPVIVAAVRTPVGRAKTPRSEGALSAVRPDTLAALVMRAAISRVSGFAEFDDIIFGCAAPEGPQGYNVTRLAALLAGVPVSVPAKTVNRFCSSGLESIAEAAMRISCGAADAVLAGGVESMSQVPMTMDLVDTPQGPMPVSIIGKPPLAVNPELLKLYPRAYLATIAGAEILAQQYKISRQAQDEFSFQSHMKAVRAQEEGRFDGEIIPVETAGGIVSRDEGPRKDTTAEVLGAKLKPVLPAFPGGATVTAGNSSQMSDGAAAVVVMSRGFARARGFTPLARFVGYALSGVAPELYGIGPVKAISSVLTRNGLAMKDIGLVELNEAFAAQAMAVLAQCERNSSAIDAEKLNVNGGAVALGHPLGCTGSRIAATLISEMRRRGAEFGLETMCIGGGMGAAAIFQLE